MKKKTNIVIEIIGWYGVVAILTGYALISFGVLAARDYPYQLLVLTGALGIITNAYFKKDSQPMVLNIIFALIALSSIISLAFIK